jgi:adenylate cyclase
VHTGNTIIGNVGSTERMNYTIIGDSVNIAARLVELTKQYQTDILISADTVIQMESAVSVKSLGMVNLKGKTAQMEVYRLEASEESMDD